MKSVKRIVLPATLRVACVCASAQSSPLRNPARIHMGHSFVLTIQHSSGILGNANTNDQITAATAAGYASAVKGYLNSFRPAFVPAPGIRYNDPVLSPSVMPVGSIVTPLNGVNSTARTALCA